MASSSILPATYFRNIKRYKIVEIVVLSVCEILYVDNWRDLYRKKYDYTLATARWMIIVLLKDELRCTISEANSYFKIYSKDRLASRVNSALTRRMEDDIEVRHNYEIAKLKIQKRIENNKDYGRVLS